MFYLHNKSKHKIFYLWKETLASKFFCAHFFRVNYTFTEQELFLFFLSLIIKHARHLFWEDRVTIPLRHQPFPHTFELSPRKWNGPNNWVSVPHATSDKLLAAFQSSCFIGWLKRNKKKNNNKFSFCSTGDGVTCVQLQFVFLKCIYH